MLTGKNKERFEEWFSENDYQPLFYEYPLSMQFGVLVDYADSIGRHVETNFNSEHYYFSIKKFGETYNEWSSSTNGGFKTRDEARKEAIKAFDEIVNGAT